MLDGQGNGVSAVNGGDMYADDGLQWWWLLGGEWVGFGGEVCLAQMKE